MIIFPNCKINLGLRIGHRRADGFHELETLFYPLAFYDALEILPSSGSANTLNVTGIEIPGGAADNLCLRAWQLLKNDFRVLGHVDIFLHKAIPVGGGLGGGSSDGTSALLLLNRVFNLRLSENALLKYAAALGSDCPFFVINKPCIARGRGELLQPIGLDLREYFFLLVNPGLHIDTRWAFSVLPADREPLAGTAFDAVFDLPPEKWKDMLKNDFEEPVFENFAVCRDIRNKLYQSGAVYASLSGTGSSVYGIFRKGAAVPQFGNNFMTYSLNGFQ